MNGNDTGRIRPRLVIYLFFCKCIAYNGKEENRCLTFLQTTDEVANTNRGLMIAFFSASRGVSKIIAAFRIFTWGGSVTNSVDS